MIRLSLLGLTLATTACLPPESVRIVQVQGDVVSDSEGPVEIWFLHTHWGEGMLKTKNMVIETQWFDGPGTIDRELVIPQTHGEGLSLYGWQDVNGDGEHCRPGSAPEPSGLIETDEPDSLVRSATLQLDQTCTGP